MLVDIRKLSNGSGHFCVRTFRLLISYPMYSCFLVLIIYLQIMDIILYCKIRTRGLFDISSINHTNVINQNHIHIFNSLPIKKIMVGQTVSAFFLKNLFEMRIYLDSLSSITVS
jgi:hypothetical protein